MAYTNVGKKPEEDCKIIRMQNRKSRWNPIKPAFISVLVGLLFSLLYLFGSIFGSKYSYRSNVDWERGLVLALSFSLLSFISMYLYQIIYGHSALALELERLGPMICTKCHKEKKYDGKDKCECGGQFEPVLQRLKQRQMELRGERQDLTRERNETLHKQ